jgi:hypothetical protein
MESQNQEISNMRKTTTDLGRKKITENKVKWIE